MTQVPLELHSCDGGSYDGDRYYNYPSTEYCPENALRNDGSVYCTKNSRCNMILQHVDKKCFTLQRLVIRAPSSGYTSPDSVREGMIFVTMDDNNLLTRTNYSIRYEDYNDEREDDSEDEIENRRAIRLPQADPCDTTQEDRESQPLIESSTTPGLLYRGRTAINLRDTDVGPSRIEATPDAAGIAAQIPLLEPHATFYNRDNKNKCVINFEPAISGRFILAKFFAGHMDDNIDIEFIGAYGYVGRRFFPATTPR
ncbi:hypothetical protein P167DRAFT_570790 [Morchella conica CCBAS932]|uniref:SUN domain-containing protein n=1 Tax=Morchella conica CCBAS932 TaxID=1392247 RepID=A0A3N4L614_9PEZI|nr:hypothetical protein P167DRAFT_570790 [Morchella conica CCBAS932]